MDKLKIEYNKLLARYHKGSVYMDSPNIALEEKMKHFPSFKALCDELGKLLDDIKDYTTDEALNGFSIEGRLSA